MVTRNCRVKVYEIEVDEIRAALGQLQAFLLRKVAISRDRAAWILVERGMRHYILRVRAACGHVELGR